MVGLSGTASVVGDELEVDAVVSGEDEDAPQAVRTSAETTTNQRFMKPPNFTSCEINDWRGVLRLESDG